MIASVLQEAGYKVGLYTSPHLKDFRERIKINGQMISENEVISFVSQNQSFFKQLEASFFEMTVALSFYYFAKEKVDIAIIETGLGGRLDSTNIINPLISVITNISMDHTNLLGNTLEDIAKEKAGIIKHKTPVIIGRLKKKINYIFQDSSNSKEADLILSKKYSFDCDLKGNYQKENINTAVETLILLKKLNWKISQKNIQNGLKKIIKNTGLQGRWQTLKTKPLVICDTGHNLEGIEEIIKQLQSLKYEKLHFVIGFVKDKNLDNIICQLPNEKVEYYFCQPNIDRALDVIELKKIGYKNNLKGKVYQNVIGAYKQALNNANVKDLVFVGGSTFVVAEVL
jgi:dihydrofolate synthase/folylpolyglutamate synthase